MDTTTLPIAQSTIIEFPPRKPEGERAMSKKPRLPYFSRQADPPPIGLTPRDKQLLETLYEHNGVLADYQIARLFFTSERRMKERMTLLYQNRYVNRFDRKERNSFDYMAYFLDTEGTKYLRQTYGEHLKFRLKGDRDSRIKHDVVVNDVFFAFVAALPTIEATLEERINSLSWDSDHDTITVVLPDTTTKRRAVVPDDYLHIVMSSGKHRRYFVEVELSRKDQPRLIEEKFRPQLQYALRSNEFKVRFGDKAGANWLYFASEEKIALKMKQTAEKLGEGARLFYFTTYEKAFTPGGFFTEPIWWRATVEEPVSLVTPLS
jgi:hypothetical protein